MPGRLLSGPAGAGKSNRARQLLAATVAPALIVDFQGVYAAMLLLERDDSGRYPERQERDRHLLPLTEYTRRAMITGALARDLFPIVTNSDGSPTRRAELLGLMGPDSLEEILDPGIDVVRTRLSVNGRLSGQCQGAINRWYGRLT